jgi:hypothetical protein
MVVSLSALRKSIHMPIYTQKCYAYYSVTMLIVTCISWIISKVCIGNRIYLILWYNSWLHFTDHCRKHTNVLSHDLCQSSGNGFQRRTFLFLWALELLPCLSHRNPLLTDPSKRASFYSLARNGQHRKYLSSLLCSLVVVAKFLYAKSLLSNGCRKYFFRGRCKAPGVHFCFLFFF